MRHETTGAFRGKEEKRYCRKNAMSGVRHIFFEKVAVSEILLKNWLHVDLYGSFNNWLCIYLIRLFIYPASDLYRWRMLI
jgi:hypothetical protein